MMDAVGSFISFLVGVVVAAAVPRKRCQKATRNGLEIQEGQGGRVGDDAKSTSFLEEVGALY